MNITFAQLLLLFAGTFFSLLGNVMVVAWAYRWKKRQEEPEERLNQLTRDMVAVREQIKYIQGRMNGHGWKREV